MREPRLVRGQPGLGPGHAGLFHRGRAVTSWRVAARSPGRRPRRPRRPWPPAPRRGPRRGRDEPGSLPPYVVSRAHAQTREVPQLGEVQGEGLCRLNHGREAIRRGEDEGADAEHSAACRRARARRSASSAAGGGELAGTQGARLDQRRQRSHPALPQVRRRSAPSDRPTAQPQSRCRWIAPAHPTARPKCRCRRTPSTLPTQRRPSHPARRRFLDPSTVARFASRPWGWDLILHASCLPR